MQSLHEALVARRARLYLAATGAGLDLMTRLWQEPGASEYWVGSTLPYAHAQIRRFAGEIEVKSFCSRETALDLASMSYVRAAEHTALDDDAHLRLPVGVGITASVASNRMPRGHQRAHIVILTRTAVRHRELRFEKARGREARRAHDAQLGQAACELLEATLLAKDLGDDVAELAMKRLFLYPGFEADGRRTPATRTGAYIPATLNPLHEGHLELARQANLAPLPAGPARFLITATPVHKPELSVGQLLDRVGQLRARTLGAEGHAIEFSRGDPLFVDKARQRPNSSFVIGSDTLERLLDPSWGHSPREVLEAFSASGTHFLVMGRKSGDRFVRLSDVDIPSTYSHLFSELPGRVDQSSSELRAKRETR